MAKMRNMKTHRLVQLAVWGGELEEPEPPRNNIVPLDFAEHRIRMIFIRGEPWWVAADVCRALGILNPTDSMKRLDDDEKMTLDSIEGFNGRVNVVNESGLYSLILSSRVRKNSPAYEQIRAFRRWVTHDVLPEIRRTGTYVPRNGRVAHEAKRLRVDMETAKARCEQFVTNKEVHRELAETGACPRDFAEYNNTIYVHEFGNTAPGMRDQLGIKPWQTPLDFMEDLPLQSNRHIKLLISERIKSLGGASVPKSVRLKIVAEIASEMAAFDAQRLGPGARIDLKDDPVRGRVIGVVRNRLAASSDDPPSLGSEA